MKRRQTLPPTRWLIVDTRTPEPIASARRLKAGDGILLLHLDLSRGQRARLLRQFRLIATAMRLVLVDGERSVERVHDPRELRNALLARPEYLFLSPLHPTRSHPEMQPMPRMRAASLARLAGRRPYALGGMDSRRYARVKPLGFRGWAGIDAFRT